MINEDTEGVYTEASVESTNSGYDEVAISNLLDDDKEYDRKKHNQSQLIVREYRDRLRERSQAFRSMPAFKPFKTIMEDWNLADSLEHCVQGCADHHFISEYFRALPESDLTKKNNLLFLADCGDAIRASREQLLWLFSDMDNRGQEKTWNEKNLMEIREKLRVIKDALPSWQQTQLALSAVGEQCKDYFGELPAEQKQLLINTGSIQEGVVRLEVFQRLDTLLQSVIEIFSTENVSSGNKTKAVEALLNGLSQAQALLEGQYHQVGIVAIRAAQSGRELDFPTTSTSSQEKIRSYGLDEQANQYEGKNGREYQVLSPLQLYQLSVIREGAEPDPQIVNRLSKRSAPLIESNSAMVWSEGKVYRPRHQGDLNRIITSSEVMNMVNTPHSEIVIDEVDDRKVVLEEFLLNASQVTESSAGLLSQADADSIIAHLLLTEDLDCHARNFIETSEGKVLRVDSKHVFQDADHNATAYDVFTQEIRFEKMVDRVRSDPFIKAVVKKCNLESVIAQVTSLDETEVKKRLAKQNVPSEVADQLVERIQEHKSIALARLQQLKRISD